MDNNPWKKFLIVCGVLVLIVVGMFVAAMITESLRGAGVPPRALGIGFLVVWFLGGAMAVLIWKKRKNKQ